MESGCFVHHPGPHPKVRYMYIFYRSKVLLGASYTAPRSEMCRSKYSIGATEMAPGGRYIGAVTILSRPLGDRKRCGDNNTSSSMVGGAVGVSSSVPSVGGKRCLGEKVGKERFKREKPQKKTDPNSDIGVEKEKIARYEQTWAYGEDSNPFLHSVDRGAKDRLHQEHSDKPGRALSCD